MRMESGKRRKKDIEVNEKGRGKVNEKKENYTLNNKMSFSYLIEKKKTQTFRRAWLACSVTEHQSMNQEVMV